MEGLLIELAAQDGAAPEWVHLLLLAQMQARDGRSFLLDDPEAVVAEFHARGIDLPIDYEHQIDKGKAGAGPIPAAGWIKELQQRADGLWGRVEWTATAAEMICSKEYRFLSPAVALADDKATIIRLIGAGLVHRPALQLTALAEQGDVQVIRQLAATLDLPADATGTAVLAEVSRRLAAEPDPAKYVPVEVLQTVLADHNKALASTREAEAEAKVNEAFRKGYLTGGMRKWALALCQQDPASFDAFMAATPAAYAHLHDPMKRPAFAPDPPVISD